jgi:hypothetical protein
LLCFYISNHFQEKTGTNEKQLISMVYALSDNPIPHLIFLFILLLLLLIDYLFLVGNKKVFTFATVKRNE